MIGGKGQYAWPTEARVKTRGMSLLHNPSVSKLQPVNESELRFAGETTRGDMQVMDGLVWTSAEDSLDSEVRGLESSAEWLLKQQLGSGTAGGLSRRDLQLTVSMTF